jgi:hypothetical protein
MPSPQAFTGFLAPAPFTGNSGTVVRWNGSSWETIATGLNFPTAMTFRQTQRARGVQLACPLFVGDLIDQ